MAKRTIFEQIAKNDWKGRRRIADAVKVTLGLREEMCIIE